MDTIAVAAADEAVLLARLVSVNVGMPKDVSWPGRTVHTGSWKSLVDGPQTVRRLNVDGDGQGDLGGHGGEQRAVLVYQLDSYRHWSQHFGRDSFEYDQFGENFTVDGLSDDEVCIGDRYRIGEAEFEVTQPRVTCFRVGMRMDAPRLPSLRIDRVARESATVTSLYLSAADGAPPPRATAGQYLTLRLTGSADPPLVRSYSISSDPGEAGYRISVKREGPRQPLRARQPARGRDRRRRCAARRLRPDGRAEPARPALRRHRCDSGPRHAAVTQAWPRTRLPYASRRGRHSSARTPDYWRHRAAARHSSAAPGRAAPSCSTSEPAPRLDEHRALTPRFHGVP